jgi:predicted RNA-binding protein with PUA-like domain
MPFLLKTEPGSYSFADLQRDGETLWDGVTNPAAVKNLGSMKTGEKLVIYHTGEERRAVGSAVVTRTDVSDPKVPRIYIKVGTAFATPRTLAEIKDHPAFAGSPLVRQGRLSVVPLSGEQYAWLAGKAE